MATLPYEKQLVEFDRTILGAQRELARMIRDAIRHEDLTTAGRRSLQLGRIIATLDQLGATVDPMARRFVEDAHTQAAARTAAQIAALGVDAVDDPLVFAGISHEAIRALQDSLTGSLRAARATIGRQVEDVYAKAGRRAAVRAVLGADGSPDKARRSMAAELLKDRDVARLVTGDGTGFVDRAGRRWALQDYCGMAVRTITREAVVQGAVARMTANGVDLARVTFSADACQVCKQYEGKLIDLAGGRASFEGEATISGPLPPYHPNCSHTISPVAVRVEAFRRTMA